MMEAHLTSDDAPIQLDELEPVALGRVSEITGSSGGEGTDRDNVVWGNLER